MTVLHSLRISIIWPKCLKTILQWNVCYFERIMYFRAHLCQTVEELKVLLYALWWLTSLSMGLDLKSPWWRISGCVVTERQSVTSAESGSTVPWTRVPDWIKWSRHWVSALSSLCFLSAGAVWPATSWSWCHSERLYLPKPFLPESASILSFVCYSVTPCLLCAPRKERDNTHGFQSL